MIERQTGIVFLKAVPDRKRRALTRIIRERCDVNGTIISDMWRAYHRLERSGYPHCMVNHSYSFYDRHTGAHTNTIECV